MKIICLPKRVKKEDILKFVTNNRIFVVLSLLLLIGVLIGAILLNKVDFQTRQYIDLLFLSNFKEGLSKSLIDIFISSLSSTFIFLLLAFFMGLSAWGCILAPLIPLFRGFCIGFSECYMYTTYGLKGIIFNIIIFLPGFLVSSIAILLMSKEAMRISHCFSSSLLFNDNSFNKDQNNIRLYVLRSGCVIIIAVLSSLLDLTLNFFFARFFYF